MSSRELNKILARPKQYHRSFSVIAILLVTLVLFAGCKGEEEETQVSSSTPQIHVPIRIDLNTDNQNAEMLMSSVGTVDDVASVVVLVKSADEYQTAYGEAVLAETSPGSKIWEGTVTNIPLDIELEFEASAYNADEEILFTDTIITSLGVNDEGLFEVDVVFEMEAVDDGIQPDNPKILSVSIPEEVPAGSANNPITFSISHPSTVEYEFDIQNGSLTTPMSGTHDPSSDLTVLYNAPGSPGQDMITIRIKDPDSPDSVGAMFPVNVVEAGSSVVIDVKFGPVITGVQFTRGEDFLMVSASTDPESGLEYQWTGTGSFAGLAESGNPIIIKPYTDADSGTIKVTVTDDYGLMAEMSRVIASGDFPYLVVTPDPDPDPAPVPDPEPDVPDGTVLDEDTGLLWQDNGETNRMSWSDAEYFCQNGLELGGYTDWRLPTLLELIVAYLHRDMFASYQRFGYWTSNHYLFDRFKAWSLRFSSGNNRIGKKKHKRLARCVRDWE